MLLTIDTYGVDENVEIKIFSWKLNLTILIITHEHNFISANLPACMDLWCDDIYFRIYWRFLIFNWKKKVL